MRFSVSSAINGQLILFQNFYSVAVAASAATPVWLVLTLLLLQLSPGVETGAPSLAPLAAVAAACAPVVVLLLLLATSREDDPSRFGGITGLLGGMGGGTPRPSGGFVADFLPPGLPPPPPNFRAAFGGFIVAMFVACCGKTVAAWLWEMAGVLCIFLGPGLVVAKPLLLSKVAELARNCCPLTIERATPVAKRRIRINHHNWWFGV